MTFSRDDLLSAFRELGELSRQAGKVIDLAVYGGSALMLVSNFRDASWDMDGVALADQALIDHLAKTIADRRGWPDDWLNDGVRTYLSPLVESPSAHQLFATYPDETRPGLRVYVPTAEYMLAMKLMALRIDQEDAKDLDDTINLMQIVRPTEKNQIVELASQFYPEARISGKLRLALDHIWRVYEAKIARPNDEPPSYLGRSGASPED